MIDYMQLQDFLYLLYQCSDNKKPLIKQLDNINYDIQNSIIIRQNFSIFLGPIFIKFHIKQCSLVYLGLSDPIIETNDFLFTACFEIGVNDKFQSGYYDKGIGSYYNQVIENYLDYRYVTICPPPSVPPNSPTLKLFTPSTLWGLRRPISSQQELEYTKIYAITSFDNMPPTATLKENKELLSKWNMECYNSLNIEVKDVDWILKLVNILRLANPA